MNVIVIDGTKRSDEILADIKKDHFVYKCSSVEQACKKAKKLNKDLIIIWHLSSSYYKGLQLSIKELSEAVEKFNGISIFAKFGVSDNIGFRQKAKDLKWFIKTDKPNIYLVFNWVGLKSQFSKREKT